MMMMMMSVRWALPVDGERLPCLLLFGHPDDARRRAAGAPHAAAPPSSYTSSSSLHPHPPHPTRLPRRTPHLLAVVQHAAGAHWQNPPAERGGTKETVNSTNTLFIKVIIKVTSQNQWSLKSSNLEVKCTNVEVFAKSNNINNTNNNNGAR